jgi:hypothetical protein
MTTKKATTTTPPHNFYFLSSEPQRKNAPLPHAAAAQRASTFTVPVSDYICYIHLIFKFTFDFTLRR